MGKKRNRELTRTDFSSFMCIILMLTGVLITIMVANVMVISGNPENIIITSIVGISDFTGGNLHKDANYIDVHRDRLDLYFDMGSRRESVPISDLENRGNKFEEFIATVYSQRETEYIVLLVRPNSAIITRRLRSAIHSQKIDLGVELVDEGMEVQFKEGYIKEKFER